MTQGQWKKLPDFDLSDPVNLPWLGDTLLILGKNGDRLPVNWVGCDQAMAFAEKLNTREKAARRLPEGWEYRLPTEAEWEYTCRAGTKTEYCSGNSSASVEEFGWFQQKGTDPFPVAQKKPNAWGLYDMHGNVWEWCLDDYGTNRPSGDNPILLFRTSWFFRSVVRGGSYLISPSYGRSSFRSALGGGGRIARWGFDWFWEPS